MDQEIRCKSQREFALMRGDRGESYIQPDEEGQWRYVYEDGTLDPRSIVNMDIPNIKLEADPIMLPEETMAQGLGVVVTQENIRVN